jgi:hypothetical protein
MTRSRSMFLALIIGTLWGTGCESNSNPKPDGSTPDTSIIADLGPGHELSVKPEGGVTEGGVKPEGGTGKTVIVTYNSSAFTVDVGKPQPVTIDSATYARLSDLVLLALPGKALADLKLTDLEGSGGFKSSAKSNCTTGTPPVLPVAGDKLAKGYTQTESLNVRWDDDLGYPGCLSPKGLMKIVLADK